MRTDSRIHQRWSAYWRGVVMSAAMAAGQIGPMGERFALQRDTIAIVRVIHDTRADFNPRERIGGLILTRALEPSDHRMTWEQSGGDLN